MEGTPVSSSNIASVGYDAATATLEIKFTNGNKYQYFDVPEGVYEELMHALSPGQFLNSSIRGSFRYARV